VNFVKNSVQEFGGFTQRVAAFGSLQGSLWSWDRQTMKLLALFHELLGSAS
jgi:hypothetical protein